MKQKYRTVEKTKDFAFGSPFCILSKHFTTPSTLVEWSPYIQTFLCTFVTIYEILTLRLRNRSEILEITFKVKPNVTISHIPINFFTANTKTDFLILVTLKSKTLLTTTRRSSSSPSILLAFVQTYDISLM